MTFPDRVKLHDKVLQEYLPPIFKELGMDFNRRGLETIKLQRDNLVISQLEDITSESIRFTPDGMTILSRSTFMVELKTVLPNQTSPNYDYEMSPWEKAFKLYEDGMQIVYIFYPAMKCAYVQDTKPDLIWVPNWRWSKQDYLRIKNRYQSICDVVHRETNGGSGTVFGLIYANRIRAMKSFDIFWKELSGECLTPKQMKFQLHR